MSEPKDFTKVLPMAQIYMKDDIKLSGLEEWFTQTSRLKNEYRDSPVMKNGFLKLRTCCNKCLACLVGLILLEVLDEASCKILSLLFPL